MLWHISRFQWFIISPLKQQQKKYSISVENAAIFDSIFHSMGDD